MKDYQKVLLLLYPKLGRLTEDIGRIVEAKARASYRGRETAEECVRKIIDYTYVRDRFSEIKNSLDETISRLNREERYLLEYKYFRRVKVLREEFADMLFPFCERTYFRRQKRLEEKLNALLVRQGMDEAWFLKTFESVPYVMAALQSVRESGAREFVDKRGSGSLRCAVRKDSRRTDKNRAGAAETGQSACS